MCVYELAESCLYSPVVEGVREHRPAFITNMVCVYCAAQVWDGRMWFAVVIPEESGGSCKHGAWVSAVDIQGSVQY